MKHTPVYYFLLFIEGFIGLSFQLLCFRQLTPVVGSSSEISAWIIGAFLGGMSFGYRAGGQKKQDPIMQFGHNLLICGLIGGIGLSSTTVDLFFQMSLQLGYSRTATLAIFSFTVIASIAYYIGQSLPLLLQKIEYGETAAERGGNALSISTIGSLAGAIIPVVLFMPMIGATLSLVFTCALCLALGGAITKNFTKILFCSTGIAAALIPYWLPVAANAKSFTSTAYADVYLVDNGDGLFMHANGLDMSTQDYKGNNASAYLAAFHHSLKQQSVTDKQILVLGAGGFMAHVGAPGNNHFTYVDIDGALASWAEKYFNFDPNTAKVITDDARSFLLGQPDHQWPVIYMDTFGSRYAMPEHLMTVEFFELVERKLAKNGLLYINAVIDPQFDTLFSQQFHSTLQRVFPFCQVTQVTDGDQAANVNYLCFPNRKNNAVYRDDKNTVASDVWQARKNF